VCVCVLDFMQSKNDSAKFLKERIKIKRNDEIVTT
jgi:hypothetical protein